MLPLLKDNPALDIEADKIPTLTAWAKAMRELPAVKATSLDASSHATWYRQTLTGAPDYDMFLKED